MRAMPDWIDIRDMSPDRSGHFLCWCARTSHMWIGAYNDSGGFDTYGEPRPLGWIGGKAGTPTHWAERPQQPDGLAKA